METILYLDMDEVLSDFVGGACKLFGVDQKEVERRRIAEQNWHIDEIIAEMINDPNFTKKQFYDTISRKGVSFWQKLEPTPYCFQVLDLMKQIHCEWYILSSPMRHWSCTVGKMKWIQEHLGPHVHNYIIHPHKKLHARKGTMLVDDRPDNVQQFRERGAQAHLFGTSPMADTFSMLHPVDSLHIFLEENNVLL